jgi:glycosyltransferase involved in cell wall biosynthesis
MQKLVIAIPTYDRPDFLRKTLDSLAKQITPWVGSAGLFVADDHPSAKNLDVVDAVRGNHPSVSIEYMHNTHNLGIDENIKKCILSPRSQFVWLLGEDDIILDGAIDRVMEIIRTKETRFIFANYIYSDDHHRLCARKSVIEEFFGYEVVYFNDFISSNIQVLGFIGGCIINREAWMRTSFEKFKGSFYSHVGGILDSCLGQEIIVMHDIAVLNRAEDINTFTWSKSTFKVYFSFFDVLHLSSVAQDPVLLENCVLSARKLFAVYSLPWLVAKRADGVYDKSVYDSIYRLDPNIGAWWKLAAALVAMLPRTPLKILRRLHLKQRFTRDAIEIL